MKLSAFLSAAILIALPANAGLIRRASVSSGGTISKPTVDSAAVAGSSIDFDYLNVNQCESGYSPISTWLLDHAPSTSEVTSSGTFASGDFLATLGNFLIPNFGLPPMTTPPPPPSTLTVPTVSAPDGPLFFAVIETFLSCPPDGHTQYGLSFVEVEYDGPN